MTKNLILRTTLLLTLVFSIPVLIMRAQPYDDRVTRGLIREGCSSPCFMGIRPGMTAMRDAYYLLLSHDWVANNEDQFPAVVREASLHGAGIPRTLVQWRWTSVLPDWIDATQTGGVTMENRDVLEIAISTHLTVGEVLLAFGIPDDARFSISRQADFDYNGWYADKGILIRAAGRCPAWHYYDLPVQIAFRPQTPILPEALAKAAVCQ